MERLRTMEYEVYIINDYKNVKNILKKNPNSILYINIDSVFTPPSWINFIRTIEETPDFQGIDIGIISDKVEADAIRNYKSLTKLEAGFFKLTPSPDANLQAIVKQLDKCNAKGRRQYVRANCLDDSSAEVFWITNNIMYKLKIIDISAVGIAVRLPLKQAGALKPGQFLNNINLMIKAKPMPINATVFAIKPGEKFNIGVFMIEKDTNKNTLSTIRTFVAEKLQYKIEDQIFGLPQDKEDYTVNTKK